MQALATTYHIKSPSGATQVGYSKLDALYAACVLAEKERRFHGKHEPVVVLDAYGKHVADMWSNLQQEAPAVERTPEHKLVVLRVVMAKISDLTSERLKTKHDLQQAIDNIGILASDALAITA